MSSTPSGKVVTQLGDEDLKKLLTEDIDDNKLVRSEDLVSEPEEKVPKNLWSDPDRLKTLKAEMQALSNVRFVKEKYPETVLMKAMAEVLTSVGGGWYDYSQFSNTIRRILTGPSHTVPFAVKTRNQRTGAMDFWLIRAFINVKMSPTYTVEFKDYNKREILMSKQFCEYLRQYCREQLKDEVQFWAFTGTYKGKQQLDMSRLHPSDINALESIGETNPDNLVMFQFKKKTPEVFVGGRKQTPSEDEEEEENEEKSPTPPPPARVTRILKIAPKPTTNVPKSTNIQKPTTNVPKSTKRAPPPKEEEEEEEEEDDE